MLRKLKRRLFDRKGSISQEKYRQWLKANAVPVDQWCAAADEALWQETKGFVEALFSRYEAVKRGLPPGMGGNACVRLLYFITRRCKPETIVETGVATGVFIAGVSVGDEAERARQALQQRLSLLSPA